MFGQNVTSAFHALLYQGQNMSLMIADNISNLFTTEALFILAQINGVKNTNNWSQKGWIEVLEINQYLL